MSGYDPSDGEESELVAVERNQGSAVGSESDVALLSEDIKMNDSEGSPLDSDVIRAVDVVAGGYHYMLVSIQYHVVDQRELEEASDHMESVASFVPAAKSFI